MFGDNDDWHKVYKSDFWNVLKELLDSNHIELAIKWAEIHNIPSLKDDYTNNWQVFSQVIDLILIYYFN